MSGAPLRVRQVHDTRNGRDRKRTHPRRNASRLRIEGRGTPVRAVRSEKMQQVHQVLAARRGPVLRGVESRSGRCAACEVTHGSMPCFCTSSRNDTRVRQ